MNLFEVKEFIKLVDYSREIKDAKLASLLSDLTTAKDPIPEIRQAVANYMRSEGCSCCQDIDAHKKHDDKLGELLNVDKYEDGSGYDFNKYSER